MKALALILLLLGFWALPAKAQQAYWLIGGDTGHVYSLNDNAVVVTSNGTYVTWLAAGGVPTHIASTSELYDVISRNYPGKLTAAAPVLETAGGLTPFQAFLYRRTGGLTITYTGQSGLDGVYPVDDQWLGGLSSGMLLRCGATALGSCANAFPAGASTYAYVDMHGTSHTLTPVQLSVIALAIQNYFATLYAQLQIGLGGGTPSWPAATVTVP
jgi:hypothetical protein